MRKLLLAIAVVAISACAANPKPILAAKTVNFELDRQRANSRVIDRLVSVMSEAPQQGPLTSASNLRVRTDANGYMMAAGQTYSSPDGPLTNFSNIRLRTDSNGYLMVVMAGGTITASLTCSLSALATTSTDCFVATNTTASTVGTTVQISPRLRWRGTGWDADDAVSRTVDYFAETVPITGNTVTGGLHFGYSLDGAATTDVVTFLSNVPSTSGQGVLIGSASSAGSILARNTSGGAISFRLGDDSTNVGVKAANVVIDNTGYYDFATRSLIRGPADGQFTFSNNAETSFTRINFGGNTSSFPALAVNGAGLESKLADNSAYTTFAASQFNAGATAGVSGTCDTPTFTGGVATTCGGSGGSVDGTYFVTGNFTTANNANFQLITGLAWIFPATTALNVPFRCSLVYSQATAAVSDSLGIQAVTVAPTNAMFTGSAETALGTTAYGDLTAFSSTTATAVVTFTPSVTATTFNAYIDGMIEHPSNVSSSAFQIQIKTTAGADAITVYRGSYCKVG